MAFLVSFMASSSSMAPSRPTPTARLELAVSCFQVMLIRRWSRRCVRVAPAAPAAIGGPHRPQLQVGGLAGQRLGTPARHGDAVGVGVVHAVVNGELPVPQPVDDVHVPERAAAVEHRFVQRGHFFVERRTVVGRCLQRVEVQVLAQIDVRDRAPARPQAVAGKELDDAVEGGA
jgi:hypothetical protein